MKPYYADDYATILLGDCREAMAALDADSIDAIVTDPPYHLTTGKRGGSGEASLNTDSPAGRSRVTTGFMGKAWDGGGIAHDVETWAAALRVAKPGAHLLAFGGTRTFHRLTCAIEDAGWEIRDCIMWVYGSGFPKSLDVSKAIDKAHGHERSTAEHKRADREGWRFETQTPGLPPQTDVARQWQGWGTALKPAWEPIIVARKPLRGTVAENVQRHGTGAINIDASRVEWRGPEDAAAAAAAVGFADSRARGTATQSHSIGKESRDGTNRYEPDALAGRWPANLIHDGSEEVLAVFPFAGGQSGDLDGDEPSVPGYSGGLGRHAFSARRDPGSAARFFYTAKATKADRDEGCEDLGARQQDEGRIDGNPGGDNPRNRGVRARRNHHPTVKPSSLMRYLVRLATPPGGVVLDPFMGSGSTIRAAKALAFRSIGIEIEEAYCAIATRRIRQEVMDLR